MLFNNAFLIVDYLYLIFTLSSSKPSLSVCQSGCLYIGRVVYIFTHVLRTLTNIKICIRSVGTMSGAGEVTQVAIRLKGLCRLGIF